MGFLGDSVVKNLPAKKKKKNNLPANAGDAGWIPGLRRSPGGGNGNPLQYSCLRNPMDRGDWQATVHRVTKESDMTWRLNNNNAICLVVTVLFPVS